MDGNAINPENDHDMVTDQNHLKEIQVRDVTNTIEMLPITNHVESEENSGNDLFNKLANALMQSETSDESINGPSTIKDLMAFLLDESSSDETFTSAKNTARSLTSSHHQPMDVTQNNLESFDYENPTTSIHILATDGRPGQSPVTEDKPVQSRTSEDSPTASAANTISSEPGSDNEESTVPSPVPIQSQVNEEPQTATNEKGSMQSLPNEQFTNVQVPTAAERPILNTATDTNTEDKFVLGQTTGNWPIHSQKPDERSVQSPGNEEDNPFQSPVTVEQPDLEEHIESFVDAEIPVQRPATEPSFIQSLLTDQGQEENIRIQVNGDGSVQRPLSEKQNIQHPVNHEVSIRNPLNEGRSVLISVTEERPAYSPVSDSVSLQTTEKNFTQSPTNELNSPVTGVNPMTDDWSIRSPLTHEAPSISVSALNTKGMWISLPLQF